MSDVVYSVAAQVDLLGFADHLVTGAGDIRTEVGRGAVERLRAIDNAVSLFETEKQKYPQLYPGRLEYFRFNDSLFLGMDLGRICPPVGEPDVSGVSVAELRKGTTTEGIKERISELELEAVGVARFLGLVARIHRFVNKTEHAKAFPGCRSVVAAGLRQKYEDRKGNDDFFSANLALSKVYYAQQKGSSGGIRGNVLYVEDNIARAIEFSPKSKAILSFAKFLHERGGPDLYTSHGVAPPISVFSLMPRWRCEEPIDMEFLRQKVIFRCLNPAVLTLLQLHDYFWTKLPLSADEFDHEVVELLKKPTATLEEVQKSELDRQLWPLWLAFNLDDDYESWTSSDR